MSRLPNSLIAATAALCLYACTSSETYRSQANELEKQGRYAEALRLLDKAVRKEPTNIRALLDRGTDHSLLGHYDSAVADYSMVIALDWRNTLAYVNRGKNKKRMENYAAAITDFNSAIDIKGGEKVWIDKEPNAIINNGFEFDVKMAEIRFERGIAYFYVDSLQKAFSDFNFALKANFSLPESYFWRGFVYLRHGKTDLACQDLRKAAALGDKDALAEIKTYCP